MPQEPEKTLESNSKETTSETEKQKAKEISKKITAFLGVQLQTYAPYFPFIGSSITGGLTWLHQHNTVNAIIVGVVTFIITSIFTYVSAWSEEFLGVARSKGKDHGKNSAIIFFNWVDQGLEKLHWKLANHDGKYLIKIRDSDCRYDDIEGIEETTFGFSTPELEQIFINLELEPQALSELGRVEPHKEIENDIWDVLKQAKERNNNLCLLILAPGGRGKTTLLRHLAYKYSIKRPEKGAPALIPVLLRLRRLQEVIAKTEELDLPGLIEKHIQQDISRNLNLPKNWAKNHLSQNKMLIMFDGFDEIKPEHTDKISQWIGKQWHDFRENYFILTSRPKGYEAFRSEHRPRKTVFINEFTNKNIKDFVYKWYFSQEQEIKVRRSSKVKQEDAIKKAEDLINQLFPSDESEKDSTLLTLARNPLNLNMILRLHRKNLGSGARLPESRADLFRQILDLQLISRPEARGVDMILDNNDEKHRQRVLQKLALSMENTTTIEYKNLLDRMRNFIQELGYPENISAKAKDFLKVLIEKSELILKKDEYYEFAHSLFQSYLIASEVKHSQQENLLYEKWEQNLLYESCIIYTSLLVNPTDFILHFYKESNPRGQILAERCYQELPVKKRENLELLKKEREKYLFSRLEEYLQHGQWREANEETFSLMLIITQRNDEGWLTLENIINFPIQDLYRIDQLWLEYSRGKFGISVQQQIYQSLGGTKEYNQDVWMSMGDRVGWRQGGSWLDVRDLNFSQTAPSGHLPTHRGLCGVDGGWRIRGGYMVGWVYLPPVQTCRV
jgi:GTPase SAR1 family protein